MEEEILNKHSLVVHSSAELSLIERKIANALLFNAFNHFEEKEESKIRVSELLALIGIRTRNYTQIYLSIRNIATTLIEWGLLKADSFKGDLTGITFLEMYRICNGLITYRLPKELKSLLYHPNQYAKIRMATIAGMSSSYGVALYENCASYSGWGDTGWINIHQFRKLMGVGIKYPKYRDFKKRVILSALEDVNKHSEFSLELLEKKEGRNTAKIKFIIHNNTRKKEEKPKEKEIEKELASLGVPKSKINNWMTKHSSEYLAKKLEYADGNKDIKNKIGFLIASIEQNYEYNKKIEPLFDLTSEKDKFKKLKQERLLEWFKVLPPVSWKELCDYLITYVENINLIVYQEFKERLYNKAYINYQNTTDDLLYFTEQLLLTNHSKMAYLKPPQLPSWREYLGEMCPQHL